MRCPAIIGVCWALLGLLGAGPLQAGPEGAIKGRLVHKQTGEPVIGAPVRLDEERITVTDEQGFFHFFHLRPGAHRLSVDDPECAPFEATVRVSATGLTELLFALDARGQEDVEEVVITAERLEQEVSHETLEVEQVQKIPGTQGDILKIVQSLPGVARSTVVGGGAMAGVVVRGSAPEDSRVLIDGHPVPLLYHFGGIKSVLNSDMLKRIDFLPGGFGAEFGRAIGGVIDVQTLPSTHQRYDGYVETSMLDVGFFVKGPIGDSAGFVAAARRSTLDAWLPYALEGLEGFEMTVAPVYYDYQAKVDWSPTPADRIGVLAFGSSDEMKVLFEKPVSGDPSLRGNFGMRTQFHRLYLRWDRAPPGGDWQLKTSIVGGYDSFDGSGGPYEIVSDVPSLRLRSDLEWELSSRWTLNAGVLASLTWFDLRYAMVRPPGEGTVANRFNALELVVGSEDWLAGTGGGYVSLAVTPMDGMLISGGLRCDGYVFGDYGDWAVMPRFSFKQRLRPGTVFKAGLGLYYQVPPENELSEGFGNPRLDMERAIHYTLGIEQQLPLDIGLDLTAFYKDLDRLVVRDEEKVYDNDGVGEIAGLEIMLRRDLGDGFFGWLAYTLMRSKRRDRPGEPWRLFDFDQTHILTLVAGYQLPTSERQPNHGLRSGWEFGLRFQLVSGNPDTPIIGGIYDADFDNYLPIPGPINSTRMPMYHRLDLRVDYTWAFVHWALSLFLDVQNVYNYRAPVGLDYNYDYTEKAYYHDLPIIPALGLRGSF